MTLLPALRIMELEAARCQALLSADISWMEKFFAEDLVWAHASGALDSKRSFINQFNSGSARCYRIERTDAAQRSYGSTTIVTGIVDMDAMYASVRKAARSRYQGVWIEGDCGAQLVAWQSARIAPPEQG
jgi:hypothetical protein